MEEPVTGSAVVRVLTVFTLFYTSSEFPTDVTLLVFTRGAVPAAPGKERRRGIRVVSGVECKARFANFYNVPLGLFY